MVLLILCSMTIILMAYLYVAYKENSYINLTSISLIIFLPANYFLPLIYNYYVAPLEYSIGYLYVYSCYLIYFVIFLLSYSYKYRIKKIKLENISTYYFSKRLKIQALIFLMLSIIMYLPVLNEFKDNMISSRDIYVATRGGYGHYFFTSLLLLYLGLMISFYSFEKYSLSAIFTFYFLSAYLHGSKSAMIWGIQAYLIFYIYYLGNKFSLSKSIRYISCFSVFMVILFALTFSNTGDNLSLIIRIAHYSDYTRNATDLINNYNSYFKDFFYGMLSLENNIYSRIPRILYQNKPRVFGSFTLPAAMFPEWFEKNVGDASFGIVGVAFADFGYFAIFYLSACALVSGVFLSWLRDSFLENKNIFYFVLMVFGSGLTFLPLGVGYLFFEHLILAFMVMCLFKIRLFPTPLQVAKE